MSNRIHSFDYIRALAILIIVACHYLEFSGVNVGLGRYLGLAGNMMFFLLSALLYGKSFAREKSAWGGQIINVWQFGRKRVLRLGASLWPFLIIVTILYLIFGITFSWLNVGMNFLFLGYLFRIPGNEHLWFLTVLMACYAIYVLIARLSFNNNWFPRIFLALMLSLMVLAEMFGIPGNAFAIIGFFAFVLMKAEWFMKEAKGINLWGYLGIVLLNIVCALLLANGLFEQSRIAAFLLSDICGCLLLALLLGLMPEKENKIVAWVSGISFEIYLVHHTLCVGPFIRITSWEYNNLFQFILIVLLSIVIAQVLHLVSNRINIKLNSILVI